MLHASTTVFYALQRNGVAPMSSRCSHTSLSFSPPVSPHHQRYTRPTRRQLATAADLRADEGYPPECIFPAPLVLPGDALDNDPKCPPQSFRSWLREKHRNEVKPKRKPIYIADFPRIHSSASFMESWSTPVPCEKVDRIGSSIQTNLTEPPAIADIITYCSAFFHPLPIQPLQPPLQFSSFPARPSSRTTTKRIPHKLAITTPNTQIQIRHRPSPDAVFPSQLNLNDLLDLCLSVLPPDAYALLLLVNQDIYESPTDIFTASRAYGGSRIAVVSSARFNPALDRTQGVDRVHSWPASHCTAFMAKAAASSGSDSAGNSSSSSIHHAHKRKRTLTLPAYSSELGAHPSHPIDLTSPETPTSPLRSALLAATTTTTTTVIPSKGAHRPQSLHILWLSRLARTSSHELSHCFSLDHCVYHACNMQASDSLAEDARQPPYLCGVCVRKLGRAVSGKDGGGQGVGGVVGGEGGGKGRGNGKGKEKVLGREEENEWGRERGRRMGKVCEIFSRRAAGGMFGGLGAWIAGMEGLDLL